MEEGSIQVGQSNDGPNKIRPMVVKKNMVVEDVKVNFQSVSQSVNMVCGTSVGLKMKPPFEDDEASAGQANKLLRSVVLLLNRPCSGSQKKISVVACVCVWVFCV